MKCKIFEIEKRPLPKGRSLLEIPTSQQVPLPDEEEVDSNLLAF